MLKARIARGAAFDHGSLIERARTIGDLLVPLFINALGRAEVLAMAVNARCYRGGRLRTKRRLLTWDAAGTLALALALAFTVTALTLSLYGI